MRLSENIFAPVSNFAPGSEPVVCPFCPGNEELTPKPVIVELRPGSNDWEIRVVPNRYPILDVASTFANGELAPGIHEVVVESAEHRKRLVDFTKAELARVALVWSRRVAELSKEPGVKSVLLFRNDGGDAGASLEHSHSQIIGLPFVSPRLAEKLKAFTAAREVGGECPLCEEIDACERHLDRAIAANETFMAFSPRAPRVPFEAWIVPRTHLTEFSLSPKDSSDFAEVLLAYLRGLNSVVPSAAYNFAFFSHPGSCAPSSAAVFHWQLELIPRVVSIAASDWGASFYENSVPPERAAGLLRGALKIELPESAR